MSMPRLSLYKPEKGQDYTFLDKTVVEMFTVGGTDVFVHKYLGPAVTANKNDPAQPNYIDGREVDPLSGEFINIEGIINETKVMNNCPM